MWPEGKKFAFTVFDDTDLSTLENVKPVYDLFYDLGLITTKSVWTHKIGENSYINGTTLEDPDYLEFVQDLQKKGFEIASHLASYNSASRAETIKSLEIFNRSIGHNPVTLAMHDANREGIYWADHRLSFPLRWILNLITFFKRYNQCLGHQPGSEFYWGDLCKDKITYVRNFVFEDLNTLKLCPNMPYHDSQRPMVQYWFAASNGAKVREFTQNISKERVDKLASEGGACIMYTHLGCEFFVDGKIDPEFKNNLTYLAQQNAWFVPVRTLLDYLKTQQQDSKLSYLARQKLECLWFFEKIFKRGA